MILNTKYFIIGIIGTIVVLIQACNSEQKTIEKEVTAKIISEPAISTEQIWPHDNKSKEFKIDSSDFKIYASKENWRISLEPNEGFENQMRKIKQTINNISKESDIRKLKKIGIRPINNELLLDIASVTKIQKELKQKRKNGIVNSMEIVSTHACKAKKLKDITNLFLGYNLEPYDYYIDKCRPEKIDGDTINLSIHCATIYFKLRKIKKK